MQFDVYQRVLKPLADSTEGYELVRDEKYGDTYTIQNTDTDTATISNLPTTGVETIDEVPTPVLYEYHIEELAVTGYWASYSESEGVITILNTPFGDVSDTTTLTVEKKWLDSEGNDAKAVHEKDGITFKLTEHKVDTQYVLVNINYVNGNGIPAEQEKIFVKKESQLSFSLIKPRTGWDRGYSATISIGGNEKQPLSSGKKTPEHTFTFETPKLTAKTEIVITLNKAGLFERDMFWGETAYAALSGGDIYWSHSVALASGGPTDLYNDKDSFMAAMDAVTSTTDTSKTYTMHVVEENGVKKTIIEGPDGYSYSTTDNDPWKVVFTNLPRLTNNETLYTYTYTVDEINIQHYGDDGNVVSTENVSNGQTANYEVTVNGGTITNKEKVKTTATATKAWKNADGTINAPENATVVFELFKDGESTGKRVTLNGKKDVQQSTSDDSEELISTAGNTTNAYESASWTAMWTDLVQYKDDGSTQVVYTVKEVTKYPGYEPNKESVRSGETIINEQSTIDLHILKVNDNTPAAPLTGAVFTLRQYKDSTYKEVAPNTWKEKQVSDDLGKEGTLTFTGLTVGWYELEEVVSPTGYIKATSNPRFQITLEQGKYKVVLPDDITDVSVSYDKATEDAAEGTIPKLTVVNHAGTALPQTGGVGTTLFTALGGLMTAMAGAILTIRRKRKTA